MNANETGVVLMNMNTAQLQSMMSVYKTTASNGIGQVWFMPQSLVNNSKTAFEASGLTWNNINTSQPYIARSWPRISSAIGSTSAARGKTTSTPA